MNAFKKFCKVIAHGVITVLMLQTTMPAFGVTPSGSSLTGQYMMAGDIRITRNNDGAMVADIPAGKTADEMFGMNGGSPMIWGRYYPADKSGSIQVSTMTRDLNDPACNANTPASCGVKMTTVVLSPAMGDVFARGNGVKTMFGGVNPFEAFKDPAGQPLYKNIALGAFEAAMGMWAKNYSSSRGFLAVANQDFKGVFNWDECTKRFLGACVKRRYHTEAYATIKPSWFVMTTLERAQGRGIVPVYRARGCTLSDQACGVNGGMSFIKASDQSDFPTGLDAAGQPEKVWHQHIFNDSWTLMAFVMIIMVVVAIVVPFTGPLLFSSMMGMGAVGVGESVLAMSIVEGVGFGLSYSLISLGLNGFQGSLGDAQDGFFTNLGDGYSVPAMNNNPTWNPASCVETGAGPHASEAGRYGNMECKNWLTPNISVTPTGVGTFFNERNSQPERDWAITNDVKAVKESGSKPERTTGVPERQ